MSSSQFDDHGLSLEGTKITATVPSTPKIRNRPSSAAGIRIKTTTSEIDQTKSVRQNSSSARGSANNANFKPDHDNNRIDFLSLFESQGRQKIAGQGKKSKASGSGSIACGSNASGAASNFSHSVFIPMSARSDSTSVSNEDIISDTPRINQNSNQITPRSVQIGHYNMPRNSHNGNQKTSRNVKNCILNIPQNVQDNNSDISRNSHNGNSNTPLESHRSVSSAHSDQTLSAQSESIHTELSDTELSGTELESTECSENDSVHSAGDNKNDTDHNLLFIKSMKNGLNGSRTEENSLRNGSESQMENARGLKVKRTFSSTTGGSIVDISKELNIASNGRNMPLNHRNMTTSVVNKTSRNVMSSANSAIYKNNINKKSNANLRQRRNSDSAASGKDGILLADNFIPSSKSFLNAHNGDQAHNVTNIVKRTKQSDLQSSSKPFRSQHSINNTPRGAKATTNHQHTSGENLSMSYNNAAVVIQRWYRSHFDVPSVTDRRRLSASGNTIYRRISVSEGETQRVITLGSGDSPDRTPIIQEVKNLLEAKKEELRQTSRGLTTETDRQANQAALKKERARRARQQKIEDMREKREEKNLNASAAVENANHNLPPSSRSVRSATPTAEARNKHNGVSSTQVSSRSQSRVNMKSGELMSARSIHSGKRPSDTEKVPCTSSDGSLNHGNASSTTDQGKTRSAVEDLLETLKKLEEEEKFLTPRNELSWKEDNGTARKAQSSEYRAEVKSPEKVLNGQFLSREKLESIMSYLDKVDSSAASEQNHCLINNTLDTPALLVPSGEEIYQLEHASQTASEVTEHMLKQRMELEENRRTVMLLRKALGQQRDLTVRQAKETEVDMKKRLCMQKEEYEEAVKRHLSFIDQLIDDKKSLSEKCEQLVKEMKTADKKYQDKMRLMKENQEIEVRKLKEVQAATEKLRREKWIEEKTKKIKELTVRGLEPEIQKLVAQHKAEVKKLKSIQEAELLAADERAAQRYVKMTEDLRDQLAREKEAACARERELARQTYEKQLSNEESLYQQQRQRLYSEVEEEKKRLAEAGQRQRVELDRLQRQLEETHSTASQTLREEYEAGRVEQQRRHEAELKDLKERLESEKESWMENYRRKMDTNLLQKERELKEQVKRDRDKEIEMVIERLEEDNRISREECDRSTENKIKRIREKYEGELAEVEQSERQITEKYNQIKAKLADVEGEYERTKVSVKIKDKDIEELKKLLDKRNEERDHISDVVRQEFVDRIVATEEENKRLKVEVSELKSRHRVELERIKTDMEVLARTKDDELEQVHKRVKEAIVKKEEVVAQLRKQYETAVKRADHLEGLLDQQRKQLLGKK